MICNAVLRGGRNSFPGCTRFSWFWPQNTWALWVILGQVYEILHSFWPQLRPPRRISYKKFLGTESEHSTTNNLSWLVIHSYHICSYDLHWGEEQIKNGYNAISKSGFTIFDLIMRARLIVCLDSHVSTFYLPTSNVNNSLNYQSLTVQRSSNVFCFI